MKQTKTLWGVLFYLEGLKKDIENMEELFEVKQVSIIY